MGKSIEDIWKEGFLKSDALVAPKINDLYNQKSIHIIDEFKRMFKLNLIAIVIFSSVFLVITFFVELPIIGGMWFVALIVLVVINKRLLNDLEKIDKGLSSYEYLKTFNDWIQRMIIINKRLAMFLYPILFISIVVGFWFVDAEGIPLGERLVGEVLYGFPDTYLIQGVPLIAILVILLIVGLLAFFGGRIYQLDLHIIYGRVLKKLEVLIADIEELKK
jgi:hypothetical protein